MDSRKLNDWLQVVGLFAVVGSLVFVGLQMQQDQEIALSQVYQARADQNIAITLAALESDTTLSFWAKISGELEEELTPEETALGFRLAIANFQHWENMHFQYHEGFVSEEHWQTQLAVMKLMGPHMRRVFESTKPAWRLSFRQVLE